MFGANLQRLFRSEKPVSEWLFELVPYLYLSPTDCGPDSDSENEEDCKRNASAFSAELLCSDGTPKKLVGELVQLEGQFQLSDLVQQRRLQKSLCFLISKFLEKRKDIDQSPEDQIACLQLNTIIEQLEQSSSLLLREHFLSWFKPQGSFRCYSGVPSTSKAQVTLPARISFAGGKSDVPPFCLERGGAVCHTTILMNGVMPIRAKAKLLHEPLLRLKSKDLRCETELWDIPDLLNYEKEDHFLLHKVVLSFFFNISCLHNDDGPRPITFKQLLESWCGPGKGLQLSTHVTLPRGSGLGTSSILMLACHRALSQVFGVRDLRLHTEMLLRNSNEQRWLEHHLGVPLRHMGIFSESIQSESGNGDFEPSNQREAVERTTGPSDAQDQLDYEINSVLAMEQLLGTGGGWNDPIGGAVPGMKLTVAGAGLKPSYSVKTLHLSDEHLRLINSRMLVIFTGQQRQAGPALATPMERWTLRERGVGDLIANLGLLSHQCYAAFEDLARLPADMLQATEATDPIFTRLGQVLEGVKADNKSLNPAWTNPTLDLMFDSLATHSFGSVLIGAGSGGFLLAWLKATVTKRDASELFQLLFPASSLADVAICQ